MKCSTRVSPAVIRQWGVQGTLARRKRVKAVHLLKGFAGPFIFCDTTWNKTRGHWKTSARSGRLCLGELFLLEEASRRHHHLWTIFLLREKSASLCFDVFPHRWSALWVGLVIAICLQYSLAVSRWSHLKLRCLREQCFLNEMLICSSKCVSQLGRLRSHWRNSTHVGNT